MDCKQKWMITFDEENWSDNSFGKFDSLEEAQTFVQENGKSALYSEWCNEQNYEMEKLEDVTCTVGMINTFNPKIYGADIIDSLRESAYDFAGEYSESYLESVKKEAEQELTRKLTEVFNAWSIKYRLQPNFYVITNIKDID